MPTDGGEPVLVSSEGTPVEEVDVLRIWEDGLRVFR
jgi:hypothetical protein